MLLSPLAVKRLKEATTFYYYDWYPYATHSRRNELSRMFLEEAEKLLDQKAESAVKHLVEQYHRGEISYERYSESVEDISQEEGKRGAAYGQEYARNQVFDLAQKELEKIKKREHDLSLTDAKKQYEAEKRKTEQQIKEVVQQSLVAIEAAKQQHEASLGEVAKTQTQTLQQDQHAIVETTKTEIEQILLKRLQEEREQITKQITEQEDLRPAREAAQRAMALVEARERKAIIQKAIKNTAMGVGWILLAFILIALFFQFLANWALALGIVVFIGLRIIALFWKDVVPEGKLAEDKRQISLFQTQSEDYAGREEKERSALLLQRIS
jgi:hypothetical protein